MFYQLYLNMFALAAILLMSCPNSGEGSLYVMEDIGTNSVASEFGSDYNLLPKLAVERIHRRLDGTDDLPPPFRKPDEPHVCLNCKTSDPKRHDDATFRYNAIPLRARQEQLRQRGALIFLSS